MSADTNSATPESSPQSPTVHLKQDRIIGVTILIVSLFLLWETFSFPPPNWDPLGIAFWPRVLLGTLLLIGSFFIIKGNLDNGPFERLDWRAFAVLSGGLLYISLIESVGFILLTPFFLFVAVLSLGGELTRPRLIEAGLVAGLGTLVIHLVFVKGLRVFLPEGLLG